VYEKGDRPGGSMLLSSCVVWRHLELDLFREECPSGDETLQRLIWERFDDALAWLDSLGAPIVWQDTQNPRTTGRRYEPHALTDVLVRRAGQVRLGEPLRDESPLILATGGFSVRLARERGLLVRSNPWSEGDGLDFAVASGAATAGDLGEFYGRAMPAPPAVVREEDFVRLAEFLPPGAHVVDESGEEFFDAPPAWHQSDLAQAIARRPGGTAWFVDGEERVHVIAGVTHTLGGIRVDDSARVVRHDGSVIDGLFAAGVDVGGIASGGYASGLAQAVVLGLVAAETLVS
jgi:fumarate reductase flavoprotein subunit